MAWFYLLILGPAIAGVVLALVWWLIWGRKTGLPRGSVGAFTVTAGLLLVLGAVAETLLGTPLQSWIDVPHGFWFWYKDFRFATPLLFGIVGLLLLAFPVRSRGGRGTAELAPRTPLSFTRRHWFIGPVVALVLVLIATVLAGAASQPDRETGHYNMYYVDLGGEMGMGTSIYGWYSSVPCLILLGLMGVIAAVDLFLISRPALGDNRELDLQIRVVRTRNVLAVATGALILHLGVILGSLAGTASICGSFAMGDGTARFWTTFAALEPALRGASIIVTVLGLALWGAVALSAIPSRRVRALVES